MSHSVSEAAARAVKNSKKVDAKTLTPEELIKQLRGNLAMFPPGAVTTHQVNALLKAYDDAHEAALFNADKIVEQALEISALTQYLQKLTAELEQFRTVYEQENRSASVEVQEILDGSLVAKISVDSEQHGNAPAAVAAVVSAIEDK